MAARMRLMRMGAKKKPFYRLVVADSRAPRDGRFIEELGYYNPQAQPAVLHVDVERARHWLRVGAKPSDTVRVLLRKAGVGLEAGGVETGAEGVPHAGVS